MLEKYEKSFKEEEICWEKKTSSLKLIFFEMKQSDAALFRIIKNEWFYIQTTRDDTNEKSAENEIVLLISR